MQNYYAGAIKNEIAYVRLSGGNLTTTVGGTPTLSFVQTAADTSTQTFNNWSAYGDNNSNFNTLSLTTVGAKFQVGQNIEVIGSNNTPQNPQILIGQVTAVSGNTLTVALGSTAHSDAPNTSTGEILIGLTSVGFTGYALPNVNSVNVGSQSVVPGVGMLGSVTVGTGAQLISSNSLTVVVGTASKFNPGVSDQRATGAAEERRD